MTKPSGLLALLALTVLSCGASAPTSQTPPPAQPASQTPAAAQTPQGSAGAATPDPWWIARYDFSLEVDGKPSPDACFYQERDSRRILINAPELSTVCIISQEGKKVTALDRAKVKLEGDGETARLLPGTDAQAATGTYSIDQQEGSVVFYVGSNRLKISPKQPLVGPTGADEITRHSPIYRKGAEAYTPAAEDISFLRSYRTPVEIEVFFGTWCPHCKVLVPKFMKTIQVTANPSLRISYHGVPQGFGSYDPARAKNVQGIPTFIFYKDGKEVGRIPGEPTNGSIEHTVAEILRSIPK